MDWDKLISDLLEHGMEIDLYPKEDPGKRTYLNLRQRSKLALKTGDYVELPDLVRHNITTRRREMPRYLVAIFFRAQRDGNLGILKSAIVRLEGTYQFGNRIERATVYSLLDMNQEGLVETTRTAINVENIGVWELEPAEENNFDVESAIVFKV